MRIHTKILTIIFLTSLLMSGCQSASERNSIANSNSAPATTKNAQVSDEVGSTASSPEDVISKEETRAESEPKAQDPAPIERKIIRNADLTLETGSPEETQQKISAIAESKKGFVVSSTQRNRSEKMGGANSVSMTIRIPANSFNASLEEIRKTSDRVIVETVSGKDVTEEFVDIEARLKTKKALEERFIEIMKRANSVKDALDVERQLANVRTEIERIEGRKRYLENQASLSTINIKLQTPTAISASSTGFFYELKEAVSDGFEAALTFILVLVRILIALIPFLVIVVLPALLLLRYFWRKYKKRRTAKKIVEEELKEEVDDK